jgi:hypothetical protein
MFRTLIGTGQIEVDGRAYVAHYFELRTTRGVRRYSCEVVLDETDRVIVDDDSMSGLELRLSCVVPATVYSRALAAAGRPSVAA